MEYDLLGKNIMNASEPLHTVFYCDDDDEDLNLFSDVVKAINPQLNCVTCSVSEDALAMLSKGDINPDVIFLDINMPILNGIELLAWLRRQHTFVNIPIIMYSTSINDREIKYCKELGAVRVLPKLLNPKDSIVQIREAIAQYLPH
jgi:CheY-like chemotaxis protein